MRLTDSTSGPEGSEQPDDAVTEEDMHAFAVGKATDEQRRRIGTQLDDPDSFANQWLDSLCAACSGIFNIDLEPVSAIIDDEEGETDEERST